MKKRILFIVNPKAGVDRLKSIEQAIEQYLDASVFDWEIAKTAYEKHGTVLAKEAVEAGVDVVVAVGGDGSVNDVVQALQGTESALGIIPLGSGNGLARSAGIPLKISSAIKLLNKLNIHAIDLGCVNKSKYFISNAGVGFDSVVTAAFSKSKNRGFRSYLSIIFNKVWQYKSQDWSFELDGVRYNEKAFMFTVANATQLGYNFQIAPVALLNDGWFDVVLIKKHPKLFTGIIGLQAFTDTLLNNRYVKHFKAKSITIFNPENQPMQIDGDFLPISTDIKIEMKEKSIKLMCP